MSFVNVDPYLGCYGSCTLESLGSSHAAMPQALATTSVPPRPLTHVSKKLSLFFSTRSSTLGASRSKHGPFIKIGPDSWRMARLRMRSRDRQQRRFLTCRQLRTSGYQRVQGASNYAQFLGVAA